MRATVRQADIVACNKSRTRIDGSNAYQWVFCSVEAMIHTADCTRVGQLVRDIMDRHQPVVCISYRGKAQQGQPSTQRALRDAIPPKPSWMPSPPDCPLQEVGNYTITTPISVLSGDLLSIITQNYGAK